MSKYTDEFLESKLQEYLVTAKPVTFSWGNKQDVDFLIKWIESEEVIRLYWYSYKYRGFSLGCQPRDFVKNDESIGRLGAIAYNRPLSQEEIDSYELEFLKEEF